MCVCHQTVHIVYERESFVEWFNLVDIVSHYIEKIISVIWRVALSLS